MPNISQQFRTGQLLTPLPEDTLALVEFSGTEFINDISTFRVRAVAEHRPVNLDDLLGEPMTIAFNTLHGTRWFNLTVFAARFLGQDDKYLSYEFELRPWFWAMARRETSRIFTKLTVEKIIEKVLEEYASITNSGFAFELRNSTPELEYTVQYRESDLNFVRRLLEEYGINFHLQMTQQKQTLVMSDSTDGFVTAPGDVRHFVPLENTHEGNVERFHTWLPQRMVTTGAVRLLDYDFTTPRTKLEAMVEVQKTIQNAPMESYDYPGRFTKDFPARILAQRRLDAFRTSDATVRGDGNLTSLGAGMMFTLRRHPTDNDKYVCLSAHHHFTQGGYRSGSSIPPVYEGYFSLTKESAPIAPERVTPRGNVRGPHTALVIDGMDGGVDKYGRITVQFHWDSNAKSMPCRVSQMWAGPKWGTIFVPRQGMEVIVEFLEGDPDRPVITGSVYNESNMPPYTLPDDQSISGIKTRTMGGASDQYNELIFDDKSGEEKIRIHGQKDLEVTIENNEKHEIKGDSEHTVKGNEKTTVVGTRTVTVSGTEDKTVTDKLTISSTTKIEIKVGPSSITIDNSGIKITAIKIEVLASAQLETNGSAMAKHTAGGMLQIQAGLVTIN
jgi:type VI secretion system secreted protein VgrG